MNWLPYVIAVLGIALLIILVRAVILARGLDRLHKMLISCRHVLDAQLVARAGAAQELAGSGLLDPASSMLLADAAHASLGRAGTIVADGLEKQEIFTSDGTLAAGIVDRDRARVETELTAVLRQLLASLPDDSPARRLPAFDDLLLSWYQAELARTFHDSRQTQVVRIRRDHLVRILRLAGFAPMPTTFDADLKGSTYSAPEPPANPAQAYAAEWPIGPSGYPERDAARVLLFDPAGRILMILGHDIDDLDHRWWFTPGGGRSPEEDPRAAAVRELFEETGIQLDPSALIGPIAQRSEQFHFAAATRVQHELFYTYTLDAPVDTLDTTRHSVIEQDVLDEFAWLTPQELTDMTQSGQNVYPSMLPDFASTIWREGWDGTTPTIR